MELTVKRAYDYLQEAKIMNDGNWIIHSLYVGEAAYRIASCIPEASADKARAFGYIHDIGRRFGNQKMNHAITGYKYMLSEDYEAAARICLTHSFLYPDINSIQGLWDCTKEDYDFLDQYLHNVEYDIYDKIIQLCDNVATSQGIVALEKRYMDILERYGCDATTMPRWKKICGLKGEIEEAMGKKLEYVLGLKTVNAEMIKAFILAAGEE